jgi:hypothetical protein
MSESWYNENLCYYEHPLSRCGAKDKNDRIRCKHCLGNGGGDCAHYGGNDNRKCSSVAANFEAYGASLKIEK